MHLPFQISGAITGAITDPFSEQADKHAELYYPEIRKMSTDVEKIAQNTGFTIDQIRLVKNYLFIYEHDLDGKIKQFDPCFQIAESWRRLAFDKDNIKPHDILLLQHELQELQLVSTGIPQNEAHDLTNKIYNYQKASDNYYRNLVKDKQEDNYKKQYSNSGAIIYSPDEEREDLELW